MTLADAVAIFVASLVVGTAAILVGVRLLVDSDAGVPNALFTALVGAAIWAASSYAGTMATGAVDWSPTLGAVLMLVLWIGVVNWRYPGGWGTAAAIGGVAWIVALSVVYGLSLAGVVTPDALLPGG